MDHRDPPVKLGVPIRGKTAVHGKRYAADHGGFIVQQEENCLATSSGSRKRASGMGLERIGLFRVAPGRFTHRGQRYGRVNAVGADAGGAELYRQDARDRIEPRLGSAVGGVVGNPRRAASLETMTIEPLMPRSIQSRTTACANIIGARVLTLRTRLKSSTSVSTNDCSTVVPAQLISMSTGNAGVTAAAIAPISASSAQIGSLSDLLRKHVKMAPVARQCDDRSAHSNPFSLPRRIVPLTHDLPANALLGI